MTALKHWCEVLVVWGAVGIVLTALYAFVNLAGNKIEGVDRE